MIKAKTQGKKKLLRKSCQAKEENLQKNILIRKYYFTYIAYFIII